MCSNSVASWTPGCLEDPHLRVGGARPWSLLFRIHLTKAPLPAAFRSKEVIMDLIHDHAGGLDVHKDNVVACAWRNGAMRRSIPPTA